MELPDDDGQTMSQLLRILYGGDPEVDGLKPRNIMQISILAHKYAITPRISSQGTVWLQTTEMYTSDEFWCLLNASFWLGLPAQFHQISKEVVRFQTISLLKLANGTADVLLGFRLACKYLPHSRPPHWRGLTMDQWPWRNYRNIRGEGSVSIVSKPQQHSFCSVGRSARLLSFTRPHRTCCPSSFPLAWQGKLKLRAQRKMGWRAQVYNES